MMWGNIPSHIVKQRVAEIGALTASNLAFGECFKESYRPMNPTKCSTKDSTKVISEKDILQSISPTMHLTRRFFKQLYSLNLSSPGFANRALSELERQGCTKAREYYREIVAAYEREYQEAMKQAGEYLQKIQTGDDKKWSIGKMSNNRLLRYARSL